MARDVAELLLRARGVPYAAHVGVGALLRARRRPRTQPRAEGKRAHRRSLEPLEDRAQQFGDSLVRLVEAVEAPARPGAASSCLPDVAGVGGAAADREVGGVGPGVVNVGVTVLDIPAGSDDIAILRCTSE